MLFVCHPKIFSLVSLEAILTSKRNQRQFLCKILEWQKKRALWYVKVFSGVGTLYKGGGGGNLKFTMTPLNPKFLTASSQFH